MVNRAARLARVSGVERYEGHGVSGIPQHLQMPRVQEFLQFVLRWKFQRIFGNEEAVVHAGGGVLHQRVILASAEQ